MHVQICCFVQFKLPKVAIYVLIKKLKQIRARQVLFIIVLWRQVTKFSIKKY